MACCSCSQPVAAPPTEVEGGEVACDARAGEWLRLVIAGLVAGQSMIFGLAINLAPPEGVARWVVHGLLALSALVVFLLVGREVFWRSWRALREGRIVMEQLFLAGIGGAFFASLHCTLTGTGHVYYEVVAILLAIYQFGQILGSERRQAAMEAAKALGVEFARAERLRQACGEGLTEPEVVAVEEIRPGDVVRVRGGQAIPVDGRVIAGAAFVREAALTGEAYPVVKREGDLVRAGSYTVDQGLEIAATVAGTGRTLDRLLAEVRRAQGEKSRLQSEADRLVAWFLPSVLSIAGLTFAFWTWCAGWETGLFNALAVLVVACPCSMGLATPVGIWAALSMLLRRGVVARKSDLVEALGRVDTVVFDKTGTLGEEQLELVDFVVVDAVEREGLLAEVAALEAQSQHPVAAAFRRSQVAPAQALRLLPGVGLAGRVGELELAVGNGGLADDPWRKEELRKKLRAEVAGSHEVWVSRQGSLVGLGILREKLRPGARPALQALQAMGLRCLILTGDRPEAAAAHNLPEIEAGLSPQDKAERVQALQQAGARVLFVGDGINDAPAMAVASASLSVGGGSALAGETAMGELVSADPLAVPAALQQCRAVLRAIRRNLAFAAAYNVVGISLAAAGILHPVVAALLMLVSSLTVTWQALRGVQEEESSQVDDQAGQSRVAVRSAKAPRAWVEQRLPGWSAIVLGLALILQGPVLVHLGSFHSLAAGGLVFLFAGAGVLLAWWGWQGRLGGASAMAMAMFGLGGLLMLVGWWADAGFAAVVREGVCLCGCAKSDMGWGLLLPVNWMSAGMLIAAVPTYFLEPRVETAGQTFWRSRWGCWLAGLVGMFVGMELAALAMALLPVREASVHFFATYAGMVMGMTLGMLVACETWRRVFRPAPAPLTRAKMP